MVGRLRSNFRAGNLAEDLGVLLLRGIAAVAEVSRPEDVGLDAIATLLRPDADGNLYAEDVFVVQLKAKSSTKIEYSGHELTWFLEQAHPMFIGRVDLAEGAIQLFTVMRGRQAHFATPGKTLTLRLGSPTQGHPRRGHDVRTGGTYAWLGPPVLEWSVGQLRDPAWAEETYKHLKSFLGMVRRERRQLSLGQCSTIEWRTNDRGSVQTAPDFGKQHDMHLPRIAGDALLILESLFHHTILSEMGGRTRIRDPLLCVIDEVRLLVGG